MFGLIIGAVGKMKEELKELEQENERITSQLNDIAFINEIKGIEKDEFWSRIFELVDNEIEQERLSNQ